jgi:hypothetical protein
MIATKKIASLGLAGSLLLAPTARADGGYFYTGNDMLRICTSNSIFDAGICSGFTAGLSDSLTGQRLICDAPDSRVTSRQMSDLAVKYLWGHPATRNYSAQQSFAEAFQAVFPCARS